VRAAGRRAARPCELGSVTRPADHPRGSGRREQLCAGARR
jgi:hypothetical protein